MLLEAIEITALTEGLRQFGLEIQPSCRLSDKQIVYRLWFQDTCLNIYWCHEDMESCQKAQEDGEIDNWELEFTVAILHDVETQLRLEGSLENKETKAEKREQAAEEMEDYLEGQLPDCILPQPPRPGPIVVSDWKSDVIVKP